MLQKLRNLRFKYGLLWSSAVPTLEDLGYSRGKLAKDIVLFLLFVALVVVVSKLANYYDEVQGARSRVAAATAREATALQLFQDCLNARGIPLKDEDGVIRTAVFCDAGKEQKI